MREWKPYLDSKRWIVNSDGNGGDSWQRIGMASFLRSLRSVISVHTDFLLPGETSKSYYTDRLKEQINLNVGEEPGTIGFYRYWNSKLWTGALPNASGDQMIPNIVAMGHFEITPILEATYKAHKARNFRYWNKTKLGESTNSKAGDWNVLTFATYIRAFRNRKLYPALLVLDLFLLLNSLIRIIKPPIVKKLYNKNDTSDDLNHIVLLLQAKLYLPTPISWLSRRLYDTFRSGGAQAALDSYFREENHGPPINELAAPILKREL